MNSGSICLPLQVTHTHKRTFKHMDGWNMEYIQIEKEGGGGDSLWTEWWQKSLASYPEKPINNLLLFCHSFPQIFPLILLLLHKSLPFFLKWKWK